MGLGCCGCSLYATTIAAGIFTLLDCVFLLSFDILLIVFIAVKTDLTDNKEYQNYINGFRASSFHNNTYITIIVLIGIKVGIRLIWLISAIILFVGNAREYRKFLNVWQYLTFARIVFAIATSIFAVITLMENLQELFNDTTHTNWKKPRLLANFTILINFLELGPIWWIILVAFMIYVYRRGHEIETRKKQLAQVNSWGTLDYNLSNGNARTNFSALAHPVSLTQEPNPFTIERENSKKEPNNVLKPKIGDSVQPILQINDVISIPRATLVSLQAPNVKANIMAFDNRAYTNQKRNSSGLSSLAQRTSYLEHERDPNKMPQRNNSYNIAQNSGQRSKNYYSYDNRGYQRSENELYKPVLIKRASVKRESANK